MSYDKTYYSILRYAVGTTMIVGVALAMDYTLAYLTPVLGITLLAPGTPAPTWKVGFAFVMMLAVTSVFGLLFSRWFLPYPMVFLPLIVLIMLSIFYTQAVPTVFKLFLLISIVIIPLLSQFSYKLGGIVTFSLIKNGALSIIFVGLVYLIFPEQESELGTAKQSSVEVPSAERFQNALIAVIMITPLLTLFFMFKWAGAMIILIFAIILAMNPATTNFKAGGAVILANIAGGIVAIFVYELLTVFPRFIFMLLTTLLVGLFFGKKLHEGKPISSLYGTAFSTFLLILGSVSTSEGEAGSKVWSRVFQISIAVVYVVITSSVLKYFIQPKKV
ncbi:DUF2955 domain-containing protein [Limibacter armeniacum]|uniref:DUF2955 domain-containing protein n=1 Tax=Limibacter armeniacum TaxID=466084 RepID=UPI002FE68373